MFYNDKDEEAIEIKHEELDIKIEIINDPPEKEENLNTMIKVEKKHLYECEECNYSTNYSEQLNRHLIEIHEIRKQVKHYECYNCGDVFTNKRKLSFHIRKELNIKRQLKCSKCEFSTFYAMHLRRHYLHKHTADEDIDWFKCTDCDHKTKSKGASKKHQETHSPTKKFKSKRYLLRHMKTSHGNNKYKCNKCDFHTVCRQRLRMHKMCKHIPDEQSVYYNCKKCEFRSKYPSSLAKHEQIHLNGCFPCDRCDYKGKNKTRLQSHLNYKHLKRNAYKCKECPYTTHEASFLKSHVKCKHTPKNEIQYFYCGHCTHKTKSKSGLRTHIKIKHQSWELQCPVCSFSTMSIRHFENHVMAKHTPEGKKKYFYCDKCDYKSLRASDAKVHDYMVHTHPDLIKWHKCPYCKAKIKSKNCKVTEHIKSLNLEKLEKNLKNNVNVNVPYYIPYCDVTDGENSEETDREEEVREKSAKSNVKSQEVHAPLVTARGRKIIPPKKMNL